MLISTVERARHKLGWVVATPTYCQLIREHNKQNRLEWCQKMINTNEQFKDVMFTNVNRLPHIGPTMRCNPCSSPLSALITTLCTSSRKCARACHYTYHSALRCSFLLQRWQLGQSFTMPTWSHRATPGGKWNCGEKNRNKKIGTGKALVSAGRHNSCRVELAKQWLVEQQEWCVGTAYANQLHGER